MLVHSVCWKNVSENIVIESSKGLLERVCVMS